MELDHVELVSKEHEIIKLSVPDGSIVSPKIYMCISMATALEGFRFSSSAKPAKKH